MKDLYYKFYGMKDEDHMPVSWMNGKLDTVGNPVVYGVWYAYTYKNGRPCEEWDWRPCLQVEIDAVEAEDRMWYATSGRRIMTEASAQKWNADARISLRRVMDQYEN